MSKKKRVDARWQLPDSNFLLLYPWLFEWPEKKAEVQHDPPLKRGYYSVPPPKFIEVLASRVGA